MKKIKISLILFSAMLIFASGMLLTSCQKEDELTLNNLEKSISSESLTLLEKSNNYDLSHVNKDGDMLSFKDLDEFYVALFKLNDIEASERIYWEKEKVFSSMLSEYCEFEKQISEANDCITDEKSWESQNTAIYSEFQNVVEESSFEMNIFDSYYSVLVNSKGQVKVGKDVYTFGKNELIITKSDGAKTVVSMLDYYNVNHNEQYKEVEILKGLGTVTWNESVEKEFYFQFSRKHKLKADITYYSSGTVKANAYNYKKNIWGNYVLTNLQYSKFGLKWKRLSRSWFEYRREPISFPAWRFSGYAGSIQYISFWGTDLAGSGSINSNDFDISQNF